MLNPRFKAALVVMAASAGLAGCTNMGPYGGVGVGVGYGSPYGYGYGHGYGNPYYGSYYGGYPYFGWHDGFYYPGSGYWVYDPWGRPSPINEKQSDYWSNMLKRAREARGQDIQAKPNFSTFRAQATSGASIPGVDLDAVTDKRSIAVARRQAQAERQQARSEQRAQRVERQQVRSERPSSVSEAIQERRQSRRTRRGGGE